MEEIVIASGVRTAIGSFGGSLADVHPRRLASEVMCESVRRAGITPDQVDSVILGSVLQAGMGMNVARQAAMDASIPQTVPAMVVNRVCGSGLQAVISAAQEVMVGDSSVVVAGGVENMSMAPYILPQARWGLRMGNAQVLDSMISDGLTCALAECHMGITAENVAEQFGVSRSAQDEFSLASQQKASQAIASGAFRDEIVPIEVRKGKEAVRFEVDEHPRPGTPIEKLAQLRAAFKPDGTVTAANASGINDGAASLVVMSASRAASTGVRPLARIRSWAVTGVDPRVMGIGPISAARQALSRAGMTIDEIDLIEANEAFAAQSLAVGNELGWDWSRVNVNGGAIALGHPIGASGARILVTLLHAMRQRDAKTGLATLCIGGGQGIAMIVERG